MPIDPDLLKHATPAELALIEETLQAELALASPADYATHVERTFLRPRHVELINDTITKLVEGRLLKPDGTPFTKVAVSLPPRHGKSEMISKYTPAWFVTRYPDFRVAVTSYEADYAATWGRKARDLVEAHPEFGVKVSSSSKAANRWDIDGRRGGMLTAGAGGPLTGKGAHLLIIDDPVKNAEEAMSQTLRDQTYDWYRSTAYTRLEPGLPPGGVVVLLQTRWHDDDLMGRVLREEPNEWFHVDIPAIAGPHDPLGRSPGAALWPERFDEAALAVIRESVGPQWWAALYQQNPVIEGGNIFRQEELRFWTTFRVDGHLYYRMLTPEGQKDVSEARIWRFVTVDLAASTRNSADFTVFALWGVTPDNELLLLDLFRQRIPGADHMPTLERLYGEWKPRFVGIERATYGLTLLQTASRTGRIPVRELKPDKDKVSRAYVGSALARAGRLYLPKGALYTEETVRELLSFPNGAHDDVVDVTAYAADVVSQRLTAPPRAKAAEPGSLEERVWSRLSKKGKKRPTHPTLGRF